MFDIGWMELLVIGVVALIVVGPRELPEMFRQIGRFTAKLRQMGREFSRAMEQAANESGLNEARKDINSIADPLKGGVSSLKAAADRFEKWDPVKDAKRMAEASSVTPAGTPATPAASTPAAAAATPTAAAAATPAPKPAAPAAGPHTAALAEKVAAKRAAARPKPAQPAASPAADAAPAADPAAGTPAPRRGGRVRTSAPKDKP